MNEVIVEILKVSLGIVVGGALSTPFKVLKVYNSTQISVSKLEQKLDALNQNLVTFNKCLIDFQVKSEVLENSIEALDRRLFRLENLVETRQNPRYSVE